ncbi:lysylphosphatidylglycerol synthase domain-containing protein [Nitrospirillum amazonense]|uniref:lysylphosphatidylglycerol synthase domain-containing protein n=1 Tax=Nitrospirillum amazonense TaxID=28077 RepID=UPI002DD421F6|nr:lysylphosphatidylglycerol synthase domain-containing protein [Nitrospirillum amazonense]MEC4589657.1 lysylphosphatidylglycerol synthase domain-containing protein [Nitrospirillum amazonense]
MKALVVIGLAAGLALGTALVLSQGVGNVWHGIALLGGGGFATVVAFHLVLIGLMGGAWWTLARGRDGWRPHRFVWGRLIRDSGSEALPLSQIGGYVLGARALALTGVRGAFAAASTVVDVTAELVAQLLYTLVGLLLLRDLRPETPYVWPILLAVAGMGVLTALFMAVQRRGFGWAERVGLRLSREFLGRALAAAGAVQEGIHAIYGRPWAVVAAIAIHFSAWVLSGVETWLTLRLMGTPLGLWQAVTVDSLLYGLRSLAFMIPNAIGVQEGALVLLGGLFGVGPAATLALSLVKRARDLAIGVPALLAWQAMEGRRAWKGRGLLPAADEANDQQIEGVRPS